MSERRSWSEKRADMSIPMLERLAYALLLRLNVEFLPLREAS